MKTPDRYIKITQGPTTAVYSYRLCGNTLGVIVTHKEPKPVLFRRGRRFVDEERRMRKVKESINSVVYCDNMSEPYARVIVKRRLANS